MLVDLIGVAAGALLSLAGLPQLVSTIRRGRADDVSPSFVGMLVGGIALLGTYVYLKHGFDLILHAEYAITVSIWLTILRYRLLPTRPTMKEAIEAAVKELSEMPKEKFDELMSKNIQGAKLEVEQFPEGFFPCDPSDL